MFGVLLLRPRYGLRIIVGAQEWSATCLEFYCGGSEVVYHVIDVIISLSLVMVYCVVQCVARLACKLCKFEYYMCTEYG